MTSRRLKAAAALFAISVILSLVSVYLYGALFSHDRYWRGTIQRVQVTQANLIKGFLLELSPDNGFSAEQYSRMFAPVDRKLYVEIRRGDIVFFGNMSYYRPGTTLEMFRLKSGDVVTIRGYQPPTWGGIFSRWISNPTRWLQPSFDYVTYPFLCFLLIYSLAVFAVGFAIKSRYLEHDVLAVLGRMNVGVD